MVQVSLTIITYDRQNIFTVQATVNDNCKGCHKLEHHSRVINYAPRVISYAPRVINMLLELSIMFLENNYVTSITHDDFHMTIVLC